MNNLESKFKQALENHEMDYDPKAWDSFKQRLDGQQVAQPNGGSKTLTKLGIAATVVSILSVGSYFLFQSDGNDPKTLKNVEEPVEVIDRSENLDDKENKVVAEEEGQGFVNPKHSEGADVNENPPNEVVELENEIFHVDDKNNKKEETPLDPAFAFNSDEDDKGQKKIENNLVPIEENKEQKITLNADFSVDHVVGCEGMSCQFSPRQDASFNGDYVWDFGDGHFSKERNPKHTFTKAGNYVVKLTLRSEINNEVLSDQAQEYISINPNPVANFEIDENSNSSAIPEYNYINLTERAVKWSWNFGDKTSSFKKDPSHTYRKKGFYEVTLTAESAFGCKSKVSKTIQVDNDYNLLAPTAFTPNGDGLNDNFIPKALEIMNAEFTMSIFHKNGQLYYETNQVSRPWDGRYMMDNQNAPGGAYVWVVKLKNKNGETEIYKGSVTLLRN